MATTTADIPTDADIGPIDHVMSVPTFEVDSHTFYKIVRAKKKGERWKKYLEDNEDSERIRKWANKNHNKPIMIRNRTNPTEHLRVR